MYCLYHLTDIFTQMRLLGPIPSNEIKHPPYKVLEPIVKAYKKHIRDFCPCKIGQHFNVTTFVKNVIWCILLSADK